MQRYTQEKVREITAGDWATMGAIFVLGVAGPELIGALGGGVETAGWKALEWGLRHPTLAKVVGVGGSLAAQELADADDDEVRALEAARRLAETGLDSDEAEELIRIIVDASTRGGTESKITVLGHYPQYVDTAVKSSATYYSLPEGVWGALSSDQLRWAVNRQFLDDAIARGNTFVFATELERIGSWFAKELEYLGMLISGDPTSPAIIHPGP